MVKDRESAQYRKQVEFTYTYTYGIAGSNPLEILVTATLRIDRGNIKPVVYVEKLAAVYYSNLGAITCDSEEFKQGLVKLDYEPTGNIELKHPQYDFMLKFNPFTWVVFYEDENLFDIKDILLDRLWGFARDFIALKQNLAFI